MKRYGMALLLLAVPFLLGAAAPPESVEALLSNETIWSGIEQSFYQTPKLYYAVQSGGRTVSGLRNEGSLVPIQFRDSLVPDAPTLDATLDREKIIGTYSFQKVDLRAYEGLAAQTFRMTDFLQRSNMCDYTLLATAENEKIPAMIKAVKADKTYYIYKSFRGETSVDLPESMLSNPAVRRQLAESDLNLQKTTGRFIIDGRMFSDTVMLLFTDGDREYLLPSENISYQAIYSGAYPSDEDLSGKKEIAGRPVRVDFSGFQLYSVPEFFSGYAPVYKTTRTLYQLQKEAFERTHSPAPDVGISAGEAPVSFKTWTFLDGTMSMSVPAGFGWMTVEAAEIKYPTENGPDDIVTNTEGTVNITFSQTDTAIAKEDVYTGILELIAILKQANPGADFGEPERYDLGGNTMVATTEFVSAAFDCDIYNLRFIINLGGRAVFGNFNCPAENSELWKPFAIQMIQSIRDNTAGRAAPTE